MNERYLFRGKRIDNGAYETGSFVQISDFRTFGMEAMFGKVPEHKHFIADKVTGYNTPVDPVTVGQCTGLHDKNDKLIFEGDIVVNEYSEKCVVCFGGFIHPVGLDQRLHGWHTFHIKHGNSMALRHSERYEIIGNVYDNPELMEV